MPTLTVHLAIVREASASVGSEMLANHPGELYLGSTTPDIRNLMGLPREHTHYVGLEEDSGRCGIGHFLQAHPATTDFSLLSEEGRSFVAGYLSHLITDETWIVEVYRPYFGTGSSMAGLPEGNMLDRALQFEIEQRERHHLGNLAAISALISRAEGFANLDLVDDDELRRWREFISRALEIEDVGQRFRYFSTNFTRQGRIMPPNRIDGFVTAFPALVARVLQHVPETAIASFRQKSIEASVEVVRQYVEGDFQALMDR